MLAALIPESREDRRHIAATVIYYKSLSNMYQTIRKAFAYFRNYSVKEVIPVRNR